MFHRFAGLTAAMALLSGCVLLSGAGGFEVVDDQRPDATDDEDGGGGNLDRDADSNQQIAADPVDAGAEAAAPGLSRPPSGTYTYAATGGDSLAPFNFKATYTTAKVTVEDDGEGCFKQTITLRDGYNETLNECVIGSDIVHKTGVRSQSFPLVGTATTNQTCDPGDVYFSLNRAPNQTWNHTCLGTSSDTKSGGSSFTTAGSFRFVADETLTVMNAPVSVAHYRDERSVTGSQTGANTADWYFDTKTGVIVKLVRDVQIQYKSVIGTITYTETVTMTLTGWTQ